MCGAPYHGLTTRPRLGGRKIARHPQGVELEGEGRPLRDRLVEKRIFLKGLREVDHHLVKAEFEPIQTAPQRVIHTHCRLL